MVGSFNNQQQNFYNNASPRPFSGQQFIQNGYLQNSSAYIPQNNPQPRANGPFEQTFGITNHGNGQDFGAVDKAKIKEGAVEISNKATEEVEENWIFQMLKNMFGIDFSKPKKTLISLGLTVATVVGLALLGNSKISVHKLPEIGNNVDDFLLKNKVYKGITGFFSSAKNSIGNFLNKSESIKDITTTFQTNKAKPKCNFAMGTGQGLRPIFSNTPVDIIKTALGKFGADEAQKATSLERLVGTGNGQNILDIVNNSGNTRTNQEICNEVLKAIAENFGCMKPDGRKFNVRKLNKILSQIEAGTIKGLDGSLNIDVSDFNGVKMKNGGIIGAWWPVNILNGIGSAFSKTGLGKKIFKSGWTNFGRGSLGNSLIKYGVVSGKLADTAIGSTIQKSLLIPTETISNFVNDKSGFGLFLCGNIMNLYNNVQDAPKEKKIPTITNDFAGSVGNLVITMPLACATVYGLATLGNIKGKNDSGKFLLSSLLKPVGKFFGMGLGKKVDLGLMEGLSTGGLKGFASKIPQAIPKLPAKMANTLARYGGGALRLILIVFVLSNIFGKPVSAAVQKIFGKPYNKMEEEAEQAKKDREEKLKKLNMTQEEALARLQAHPEVVQAIQNDPRLIKAIEQDPSILIEILASLPETPKQPARPMGQSDLLKQYLTRNQAPQMPNGQYQSPYQQPYQQNPYQTPYQQPYQAQTPYPQGQYAPYPQYSPYGQNQSPYTQNFQTPNTPWGQTQIINNPAQFNPENYQPPATTADDIPEPPRSYVPSSRPFSAYANQNVQQKKQKEIEITNPHVQDMMKIADEAAQKAQGLYAPRSRRR